MSRNKKKKETIESLMKKGYSGLQALELLDIYADQLTVDDICAVSNIYDKNRR